MLKTEFLISTHKKKCTECYRSRAGETWPKTSGKCHGQDIVETDPRSANTAASLLNAPAARENSRKQGDTLHICS